MKSPKPYTVVHVGTAALAVGSLALATLFPAWADTLRSVSGDYGPRCGGFADVDSAGGFCANVEWVRNRGITVGCSETHYCPDSNVTRAQMAIFLSRLDRVLVPTLIDAVGTAIGAYARESSPLAETVFYRTTDHVYALPLVQHNAGMGFYQFATGTVHFEFPDCTGQAYVDTSDAGRVIGRRYYRLVKGPDTNVLLYASVPEAAVGYHAVGSYLSQGLCGHSGSEVFGRPAALVEDLDLRFEAPFQLK